MKYLSLLQESLRSLTLKRVRIKIDPAQVTKECDFTKCTGYEGYVLEECGGSMKILVLSPEMPVHQIPDEFLEILSDVHEHDTFSEFKALVIKHLAARGKTETDPVSQDIIKSETVGEIESALRQAGATEEDLTKLYRHFIEHEDEIHEARDEDLTLKDYKAAVKQKFSDLKSKAKDPATYLKVPGKVVGLAGKAISGLGSLAGAIGGRATQPETTPQALAAVTQAIGGAVQKAGAKLQEPVTKFQQAAARQKYAPAEFDLGEILNPNGFFTKKNAAGKVIPAYTQADIKSGKIISYTNRYGKKISYKIIGTEKDKAGNIVVKAEPQTKGY